MTSDMVVLSLQGRVRLLETIAAQHADAITRIAQRYVTTLRGGGTLFFVGNGGSAADAQHIATEYVVRYAEGRKPLRAVALTTDAALLTACGNDFGFEEVFARQIDALAGAEDLVVIHSTSGESPNVFRAAEAAKRSGAGTVGFLGKGGGSVKKLLDEVLVVPSSETALIQEVHLALEHIIVELVEAELSQ